MLGIFEEESSAIVIQVGCSHSRWGGASEGESKAWLDGSVEDYFYVSDGFDFGGGAAQWVGRRCRNFQQWWTEVQGAQIIIQTMLLIIPWEVKMVHGKGRS